LTEQQLIAAAIAVRANAYAPYSKFAVGCALITADGSVYTGCNVENSSYGLGTCAERNAIGQMVADGKREIAGIYVAASPQASPCGACRQWIVEFGQDTEVVCVDADRPDRINRWKITELIPDHFHLQQQRR
jgi:cytidine deaminase